mmetsp:Transcript_26812/g.58298  ORF Transcript_26812/g.58298 Transcript_26812/m.58298 type:complete len:259 (+) Transcript_26812:82-858(+)
MFRIRDQSIGIGQTHLNGTSSRGRWRWPAGILNLPACPQRRSESNGSIVLVSTTLGFLIHCHTGPVCSRKKTPALQPRRNRISPRPWSCAIVVFPGRRADRNSPTRLCTSPSGRANDLWAYRGSSGLWRPSNLCRDPPRTLLAPPLLCCLRWPTGRAGGAGSCRTPELSSGPLHKSLSSHETRRQTPSQQCLDEAFWLGHSKLFSTRPEWLRGEARNAATAPSIGPQSRLPCRFPMNYRDTKKPTRFDRKNRPTPAEK